MSDTTKYFHEILFLADDIRSKYRLYYEISPVLKALEEISKLAVEAINQSPINCATFGLPTAHSDSDH